MREFLLKVLEYAKCQSAITIRKTQKTIVHLGKRFHISHYSVIDLKN